MCLNCLPRRRLLAWPAVLAALPAQAAALRAPAMRHRGPELLVTLDCCPGGFDQRLAAGLVALGIPATCCLTGDWIGRNPQGLAFLLAHPALFGFANHGLHHRAPVLQQPAPYGLAAAGTPAALAEEVEAGAAVIARATGALPPGWYRGAGGLYDAAALEFLAARGVALAGFSLAADQGAQLPGPAVARRLERAHPGEVILAHLNQPGRSAGQGVLAGLAALQAGGARFGRLDQLPPAAMAYA